MSARNQLPRELSAFLVQLSISLYKAGAYPAGHPQALAATEAVVGRLNALLGDQPSLSVGIARTQLLIRGLATEPSATVLRELAQRLHRHHLGAVTFLRGLNPPTLGAFLAAAAREPDTNDPPIGRRGQTELRHWPNIQLTPLGLDQLELGDDGAPRSGPESSHLWLSLAGVAVNRDLSDDTGSPDVLEVAEAIERRQGDQDFDREIVRCLVSLAREARDVDGLDAAVVRQLDALIAGLSPAALQRLLVTGVDLAQTREFVGSSAAVLPVDAVLSLITALADARKQVISQSLLRVLGKLASHAKSEDAAIRLDADSAFRQMAEELLDDWTLDDPNPEPYTLVLDRLARAGAEVEERASRPSEAARVVKTSLEVGVCTETSLRSCDEMISWGELGTFIDLLEEAEARHLPTGDWWAHLALSNTLKVIPLEHPHEFEVAERIFSRLGLAAVEPMLDALITAESRATRRRLLTRLGDLGPDVAPFAIARLKDGAWYVQRNMLSLIAVWPTLPIDFSPAPYAASDDARVRREAIKLMLRDPTTRTDALAAAVSDPDDAVTRIGLNAAVEDCPSVLAPKLVALANNEERSSDLHALAIRALAHTRTPSTRAWLLQRVEGRRRFFQRRRLAGKTPELLAALSALAHGWPDDPTVKDMLAIAAASHDADIRRAVGVEAETR